MVQVAGVDGFKRGWVVVLWDGADASLEGTADFFEVLRHTSGCARVAIDMPIGFLDAAEPGGRACERAARKANGVNPASVFSSPVRGALTHAGYPGALAANRASSPAGIGISKQCFMLFPKMRDIDGQITPTLQGRIKEVHPEVSFAAMARQADSAALPLARKKSAAGQAQRRVLLEQAGFTTVPELLANGRAIEAAVDDVLDACAAAWSAGRLAQGQGVPLPAAPPTDSRGLEMAIWY